MRVGREYEEGGGSCFASAYQWGEEVPYPPGVFASSGEGTYKFLFCRGLLVTVEELCRHSRGILSS